MWAVQPTAVLQRMSQGEVRRNDRGQRKLHTRPNGLFERIPMPACPLPRDPKLCPVQPALSHIDTGGAASWPLALTAHTTLRRVQLETLGVRSLPAATHRVPLPARPPPPLRCHGPHDPAMRVRA